MLKRAQGMLQVVQDGVRNTMRVVADLAESVGVPPAVTSLLQPKNGADEWAAAYQPPPAPAPAPVPTPAPPPRAAPVKAEAPVEAAPAPAAEAPAPAAEAKADAEADAPKVDADAEAEAKPDADAAAAEAQPAEAAPAEAAEAAPAEAAEAEPKKAKKKRTAKRRELVGDKARSKDVRPLEVDDAIDGSTYLARIIWSLGVAALEGVGPLRPADIARMVMSRSPVSLEPPNVARYIRRSKPQSITVDHVDGGSNYYKLNAKGKKLFQEHFGGTL